MNLGLKSGEMQSFEGFEKTLKRTEASVPNSRKSVGSFPGFLGNDPHCHTRGEKKLRSATPSRRCLFGLYVLLIL